MPVGEGHSVPTREALLRAAGHQVSYHKHNCCKEGPDGPAFQGHTDSAPWYSLSALQRLCSVYSPTCTLSMRRTARCRLQNARLQSTSRCIDCRRYGTGCSMHCETNHRAAEF